MSGLSKLKNLSLRHQVILALGLAAIAIAFVSGKVVERLETRYLMQQVFEQNENTFNLLSSATMEALITEDAPVLDTIIQRIVRKDSTIAAVEISNETGITLAGWKNPKPATHTEPLVFTKDITLENETFGRVRLTWNVAPMYREIRKHALIMQGFTAIAMLILAGIILGLMNVLAVSPINFINRSLIAFSRGEFHRKVQLGALASRELRHLAESSNKLGHAMQVMRATEEQLRLAKEEAELTSRAKSEFLANMSHELRTPLNAVIGFSEMLKNEQFGPLGNDKYTEYASDIHNSGRHLLEIISDILDLSKIESGKLELCDEIVRGNMIVDACLRIVKERAQNAGVTITKEIEWNGFLFADARILKQILINLLSNAIKFTPEGGQIFATMSKEEDGSCAITIRDTGIGMAEDDIPKALSPFGQVEGTLNRKYEGTGLGLPLAKAMSEAHGGRLSIESELGVGTTVRIILPPSRVFDTHEGRDADGVTVVALPGPEKRKSARKNETGEETSSACPSATGSGR